MVKNMNTVFNVWSKRVTNFATLSELGRFPLHFDIIKSMIRYWHRLENLDSNFTLLKDAYEESKKICSKDFNIHKYFSSSKFVLNLL
jgi:hypothetical protein